MLSGFFIQDRQTQPITTACIQLQKYTMHIQIYNTMHRPVGYTPIVNNILCKKST